MSNPIKRTGSIAANVCGFVQAPELHFNKEQMMNNIQKPIKDCQADGLAQNRLLNEGAVS